MHSTGILDLDRLVSPISQDHPAGFDPRTESCGTMLYRAIRSARSSARSAERRIAALEDEANGLRPNWKPVLDLAIQILSEQSKDLEIVAYLIESVVRLHGFAGLREGFRLCRLLIERYWLELFPRPDEDDLETRVSPLMGLNGEGTEGTLIIPILNVPLTCSSSIGNFACAHHDQATTLEGIVDPKVRTRRIEQGAVSLKTFLDAASDTPLAFYLALDEQIRGSLEEFQVLTALLDGFCGEQAPHSSNIRNALLHCQEVVSTVAGDRIKHANRPVRGIHGPDMSTNGMVLPTYDFQSLGLAEAVEDESEMAVTQPFELAQGIPSRDHALMMLEAIAAFFRQTEPHSPIPYTLEQAVRWGRMPLPDLLSELIPDQHAREHYYLMVGISAHARVS